jgi:subtilisin family serine protease
MKPVRGIFSVVALLLAAQAFSATFDLPLEMALDAANGGKRFGAPSRPAKSRSPAGSPNTFLLFGKGDPSGVVAKGGKVQTRAGDYFTAVVPVSSLEALRTDTGVEFLRLGGAVRRLNDLAVKAVSVDTVHAAGYTGSGVLVGIVDSGIDLTHPDFQLSNGHTRIVALWDQTSNAGTPPTGFTYGSYWTHADIDAGLCPEVDDAGNEYHGTHVTGIAAGNGMASGGKYAGTAPAADIVFVKLDFDNQSGIADAVNWIFSVSKSYNLPCAVNLSLGTQSGSHTTNDAFNLFMDSVVNYYGAAGHVIVWAAGNEGSEPLHASNRVSTVSNTSIAMTYNGGSRQLDFWYPAQSLSMAIVGPGDSVTNFFDASTNAYSQATLASNNIILECSTESVDEHVSVSFVSSDSASQGQWTVIFSNAANAFDVHGYVSDYDPSNPNVLYFNHPDYNGTLGSTACQRESLCAAAEVSRTVFTNASDNLVTFTNLSVGNIAYFSSRGPARDGRLLPDVGAPGSMIISTLAYSGRHLDYTLTPYLVNNYYTAMEGTSMAAPLVTAVTALMLSKDPSLPVEDVRSKLHAQAKSTAYKTDPGSWDPAFGYGLIDAGWIVSESSSSPDIAYTLHSTVLSPRKNPSVNFAVIFRANAVISGRTAWAKITDGKGGTVRDLGNFNAGEIQSSELTWDAKDASGRIVVPGVYYALVSDGVHVSRYPVLVLE